MRYFVLCLMLLSYPAFAAEKVDLEKTMKQMALEFKQANEATTPEQLSSHISSLKHLTQSALQAEFAPEKAEQFKQGLQQVLAELTATETAIAEQDQAAVLLHLKKVDELRKKYHQQREVSIWKLLFG